MTKEILVVKASGKKEPFSEEKVRRSIRRAGIPSEIEEQVVDQIRAILYDQIPTREIYKKILEFLKKSSYPHGRAKYSLKQAIMALGPSGYPFEKFMTEVFKSRGYEAESGVVVRGKCARHEIDVVVKKGNLRFLVECKFHNRSGIKTDIKTALYVKARFDDVLAGRHQSQDHLGEFNQAWLVTNTKFTHRATRYSQCAGIKVLGWNYPQEDSLSDWLGKSGLHPLTCLFTLTQHQKMKLLEQGIVLCRDLLKTDHRLLHGLGFSTGSIERVLKEARVVCGTS